MVGRVIKLLLCSPLILLVACAGPGSTTISTDITPAQPPIDTRVPAAIETATFALG